MRVDVRAVAFQRVAHQKDRLAFGLLDRVFLKEFCAVREAFSNRHLMQPPSVLPFFTKTMIIRNCCRSECDEVFVRYSAPSGCDLAWSRIFLYCRRSKRLRCFAAA